MKTYRLIINGAKDIDDELFTNKSKLLKVISKITNEFKVEVMVYEGTREDQLENYRMTLDRNLIDQGY